MIAKGKFHWVIEPLIMGVLFTLAAVGYENYVVYIIANIFFGMAVLMMIILRDPPRSIGKGVVAPIDGKVVHVDRALNNLTIRAGLLNVKVVRAPISGTILDIDAFNGKYLNSNKERKGVEMRIATGFGVVRIVKSARFSLTRATPYIRRNVKLRKGQKIAGIFPVAYVSIELPDSLPISVQEGQKVVGGQTTIAEPDRL